MTVASAFTCAGCHATLGGEAPLPFRCPSAVEGDDVDHVLRRVLPGDATWPDDDDPNPFVRYRRLFHAYAVARAHGLSDDGYVGLVRALDDRVAAVDGAGFRETPFREQAALSRSAGSEPPGGLLVKDESGNVSGSHKGRHLMGALIWLEVVERVGLVDDGDRPLAVASCGNAALAAGVLARAAHRHLDVYVPTWADEPVFRRLQELDAAVHVIPREEGVAGDPTYRRLKEAIRSDAIPFTCQGPDDGLAIEGGLTIGYEIADAIRRSGDHLDRLTIQVGGGALASAVIQGLAEANALGAIDETPAFDVVQTEGGWPLARAYDLVAAGAMLRLQAETGTTPRSSARADVAALLHRDDAGRAAAAAELAAAARHRSAYMWPWETEPRSVATGILDDETYDWLAVVEGMLATGGVPYVVTEEQLEEANALARETTGIDVDHTGSAGLAGLLAARRDGAAPSSERAGLLFTGRRR